MRQWPGQGLGLSCVEISVLLWLRAAALLEP